ncbi:WG repeat-containing protein [Mangrovivirga cuniculi]|uniref:Uncharacterized protein n=1 Tax=Mangrovivirga cuniculi TaxID=2715131 RepID=A0A4D7JSP5_9BACT|nr:WG repeat-containing protein [Mangrovivirga cuniculi]QCK13965.1 hypothetical protein DCC35_03955 [Mangrovivirga cuniculi]
MRSFYFILALILSVNVSFAQNLIPFRKGDKWGYVNKAKKVIIDFKYDNANPFQRA